MRVDRAGNANLIRDRDATERTQDRKEPAMPHMTLTRPIGHWNAGIFRRHLAPVFITRGAAPFMNGQASA